MQDYDEYKPRKSIIPAVGLVTIILEFFIVESFLSRVNSPGMGGLIILPFLALFYPYALFFFITSIISFFVKKDRTRKIFNKTIVIFILLPLILFILAIIIP
jgi:hypothetical protein